MGVVKNSILPVVIESFRSAAAKDINVNCHDGTFTFTRPLCTCNN